MVVKRQPPCVAWAHRLGGNRRVSLSLMWRTHSETVWVRERLWARQVKGGGGSYGTTVDEALAPVHLEGAAENRDEPALPVKILGLDFPV
jgi:hypothetical protein